MQVWEGSGGLPRKLFKRQHGSCSDGFDQCEFGMELILRKSKAVKALYDGERLMNALLGKLGDSGAETKGAPLPRDSLKLRKQTKQW